ncbi:hypothetical protein HMPREF9554_02469 [Treponema phagedenis F0421]|nr:hypothetical protein HMPREF9554_02469 [Treponema phagedenis F0421]
MTDNQNCSHKESDELFKCSNRKKLNTAREGFDPIRIVFCLSL